MDKLFLKQWNFLTKRVELSQLSHAYLFCGFNKTKKEEFAKEFIKYIYCLNEDTKPCQKCSHCYLIDRENFPDFKIVKRKEEKKEIEISQIKEIKNFLSYKPYTSEVKTVLIKEAELMNEEAQNCFLKTLEEPRGSTLIILLAKTPDLLLPTIVSRCQIIKFVDYQDYSDERTEEEKTKKELLKLINSSLAEKFDYVSSIASKKEDIIKVIELLERILRKLLFLKINGKDKEHDSLDFLEVEKKYDLFRIIHLLDLIQEINKQLFLYNVNLRLALEIILMEL